MSAGFFQSDLVFDLAILTLLIIALCIRFGPK